MKRITGLLLAIVMMFNLTACGGGNSAGGTNKTNSEGNAANTASNTTQDDGKIHINYWYAWKDKIGESKEKLVEEFNNSQDEIVVHAEYQGTYDELNAKTQAAYAAGEAPEVFDCVIDTIYSFANGGLLQELTPMVTEETNLEDFNKGLMMEGYVDGKLYGLPFYRSTPILYKNKTMLEAAGLDPAGPRDWNEMEEYCRVLRDESKDVYGLSYFIYIWIYQAFTASGGGQLYKDGKPTVNDPAAIEAAEFLQKMYNENLMKVSVGEQGSETTKHDYINQMACFMFTSTADLSYFLPLAEENGFELDVSFIPKNPNGEYAVPTGGCDIVMTSGHDQAKQEAAWKFISWITDTEQTAFSSSYTGYLPARYSALETDTLKNLYAETPQYKVAVDQLEYAIETPVSQNWPEVIKLLGETVTVTTTENKDVKKAFDDLQAQAEAME